MLNGELAIEVGRGNGVKSRLRRPREVRTVDTALADLGMERVSSLGLRALEDLIELAREPRGLTVRLVWKCIN